MKFQKVILVTTSLFALMTTHVMAMDKDQDKKHVQKVPDLTLPKAESEDELCERLSKEAGVSKDALKSRFEKIYVGTQCKSAYLIGATHNPSYSHKISESKQGVIDYEFLKYRVRTTSIPMTSFSLDPTFLYTCFQNISLKQMSTLLSDAAQIMELRIGLNRTTGKSAWLENLRSGEMSLGEFLSECTKNNKNLKSLILEMRFDTKNLLSILDYFKSSSEVPFDVTIYLGINNTSGNSFSENVIKTIYKKLGERIIFECFGGLRDKKDIFKPYSIRRVRQLSSQRSSSVVSFSSSSSSSNSPSTSVSSAPSSRSQSSSSSYASSFCSSLTSSPYTAESSTHSSSSTVLIGVSTAPNISSGTHLSTPSSLTSTQMTSSSESSTSVASLSEDSSTSSSLTSQTTVLPPVISSSNPSIDSSLLTTALFAEPSSTASSSSLSNFSSTFASESTSSFSTVSLTTSMVSSSSSSTSYNTRSFPRATPTIRFTSSKKQQTENFSFCNIL